MIRLVCLFIPLTVLFVAGSSTVAYSQEPHHHGPRWPWIHSPQVPEILRTALTRGAKARYVGVRMVQFARDPGNLRHEEIVSRDGPRFRVEFPQGSRFSGQVIVETPAERKHYFPDRNEVLVQPPHHEETMDRLARLAEQGVRLKLVLTSEPGDRVAGFATEMLVVADPKGNVQQRLYIEPETGVLLKRDIYDAGGANIGSFEFTQIDLNPPAFDPSLFRFERRDVRVVTPYDLLRDLAAREHLDPLSLPPQSGYRLDQSRVARIHGEQTLVEEYRGRGRKLTLFEVRAAVNPDRLRRVVRNDVHASSWQSGPFSYILVGNIDQAEIDRLAQMAQNGTR